MARGQLHQEPTAEQLAAHRERVRKTVGPAWRATLQWAYKRQVGTVLTWADVKDLVEEFDAMCAERKERKRPSGLSSPVQSS